METAARPDNPTIQLRRSVSPRSGSTIHRDVSDTKPDTSRRYIFHNDRHIHAHHAAGRGTGFTWTPYLAEAAQFKCCRQGFFSGSARAHVRVLAQRLVGALVQFANARAHRVHRNRAVLFLLAADRQQV